MGTSTDYVELATFKGFIGIQNANTNQDPNLALAISAASRAIDGYCRRHFYQDAVATARTYQPQTLLDTDLEWYPEGGDISTTTDLVVQTDAGGDGIFETLWLPSDYELLPVNAQTAYAEPRPYTALRAVGSKTFPWLVNTWLTRLDRVKVTALWGWSSVPTAVQQACLIKAARVFFRKDSPQGVAGFGEMGPIRIMTKMDPDVVDLLDGGNYRRIPVLVA